MSCISVDNWTMFQAPESRERVALCTRRLMEWHMRTNVDIVNMLTFLQAIIVPKTHIIASFHHCGHSVRFICISARVAQNTKQREYLAAHVFQSWQDDKQNKTTRWDTHAGSYTPEGQYNQTAKQHVRKAQKNCRLCVSMWNLRRSQQCTQMTASKFTQENMCMFERTNCWNRIASVFQATIGAIRQSMALRSDNGRRINCYTHASKNRIRTSSPSSHGQYSSTQRCDRKPSRMFALPTVNIAKKFLKVFRARPTLLRSDWEVLKTTHSHYFWRPPNIVLQSHATHRFQVLVLLPFSQCFSLRWKNGSWMEARCVEKYITIVRHWVLFVGRCAIVFSFVCRCAVGFFSFAGTPLVSLCSCRFIWEWVFDSISLSFLETKHWVTFHSLTSVKTRAPCRRRIGGAVHRAEKFWRFDYSRSQSSQWRLCIFKQSSICNRGAGLGHPNGSSRIRAKHKLRRKHKGACKSSWSQIGSLKSITQTTLWNLAKLVKIFLGII